MALGTFYPRGEALLHAVWLDPLPTREWSRPSDSGLTLQGASENFCSPLGKPLCLLFLNYHFSLLKEKFASIDNGGKTRKNGKCPLLNKIMCLIIITRNGPPEGQEVGCARCIFIGYLHGSLTWRPGQQCCNSAPNPVRSRG